MDKEQKGTREDALMLIELAQLGVAMGLGPAMDFIYSPRFTGEAEAGTDDYSDAMTVLRYYETLATIWKNGHIDEELLLDWVFVVGIWEKVKPLALAQREQAGVAGLWENFEALADSQQTRIGSPEALLAGATA